MYKVFFNERVFALVSRTETVAETFDYVCDIYKAEEINEAIELFYKREGLRSMKVICKNMEACFAQFTTKFKLRVAAGGLVTNSDKHLLVIERNERWDLPKGHQDPGENVQQTALREVSEECGITNLELGEEACITYHVYNYNEREVLKETHWYFMKYSGNEQLLPQANEGITKAIWVAPDRKPEIIARTYQSLLQVFEFAFV